MSAAPMADSPLAVLLVDGGSPQAEALRLALTAKGYVCSRASTAIEAIQLTMDTVFPPWSTKTAPVYPGGAPMSLGALKFSSVVVSGIA